MVSVWEKESFFAPSDVIIAGSGFTGLWSAYYLKKNNPGLSVTILDRGWIPTGASTRNAGFACFGSATELLKDAVSMGEDAMLTLVEQRYRGISRIREIFKREMTDFDPCGGYELISSANANRYPDLPEQVDRLNKSLEPVLKKRDTFVSADEKITAFGFSGVRHLLFNEEEGSLHPGKLCMALIHLVQGMHVNILPGTEVTGIHEHGQGVTVHTGRGVDLAAKQLLVCTNGFVAHLLPQLEVRPARGQVLVTSPVPGLRIRGTFHYDEGFYYFRNLGNRLLLGGARNLAMEEESTDEMAVSGTIQQALEDFLSTYLLPGADYAITDRWSGIMGVGAEKMPVIKKLSSSIYCAVRMSGMGVALAPVAGEQAAMLMTT